MEFVQETEDDRGHDDAYDRNERQSAEQGVKTGKQFAGVGLQGGHGSHAGQNHRGVEEGVDPGKFLQAVIANHADAQANGDDGQSQAKAAGESGQILAPGQQRCRGLFVHGRRFESIAKSFRATIALLFTKTVGLQHGAGFKKGPH